MSKMNDKWIQPRQEQSSGIIGMREFVASRTPQFNAEALNHAMSHLLLDEQYVWVNCQIYGQSTREIRTRCQHNLNRRTRFKKRADFAATAVIKAMELLDDDNQPLPLVRSHPMLRDLTILATWWRMQKSFDQGTNRLKPMLAELADTAPLYAYGLADILEINRCEVGRSARWRFAKPDFYRVLHAMMWSLQACDRAMYAYNRSR